MAKLPIYNPARTLRVLVLPIRRHPTPLTYYHVLQPPPAPVTAEPVQGSSMHPAAVGKRAIAKATQLWDSLGDEKRSPTSWQRRVYYLGMMAMERVPFEESALKHVDPKAWKSASGAGAGALASEKRSDETVDNNNTAVLVHLSGESGLDTSARWAAFLNERVPMHRRRMILWAGLSPLMTPFMIVPVIPNLPFFFCAWRAWGHYQAWNAAKFLQTLPLQTEASPQLDDIFSTSEPDSPSSPSSPTPELSSPSSSPTSGSEPFSPTSDDTSVLTVQRAAALTKAFGLSSHIHADLIRAVGQAQKRTEKEQGMGR
ncbi:mitochondrial K+-H+ exchange-related-domain-containing protein [Auriculariales sp. MPI-PUGE-AT-0066]|nr:mitochondrial K+-H+ exchange-related-domain-containing protein [Auriculariales sp. MPI-PUGE-AT-0066]